MPGSGSGLTLVVAACLSALVGIAAGIGAYTFAYAQGASYLTNDPEACVNCHVMREQYDGWRKSSHHAVAVCNDCHAPHSLVPKYWVKATNGFWHSFAFTSGRFHEPIRITRRNRRVTEAQCRYCHGELAAMIEGPHAGSEELPCIRCHDSVGHRTAK